MPRVSLPSLLLVACLGGCAGWRSPRVDDVAGYWVARGQVVAIQNLDTSGARHRGDEVRWRVLGPGCTVTLLQETRRQHVRPVPGSVIVLAPEGDRILLPLEAGGSPPPGASRSAETAASLGAAVGAAAGGPRTLPAGPAFLELGTGAADGGAPSGQEGDGAQPATPSSPEAGGARTAENAAPAGRRVARSHVASPDTGTSPGEPAAEGAGAKAAADADTARQAAEAHATGRGHLAGGRTEEALSAFERAYALDPAPPEHADDLTALLKSVGLEHYSRGDVDEALRCWKRALELHPEDEETRRFIERARAVAEEE